MELIGKVVGTKINKTALVEIERLMPHPLYKKRLKKTKKFQVHDEIGVKIGDKVKIVSSRPVSRGKHFKVSGVIEK
jgi:small subunit ribosomal protein S17